jgi:hypothetical protein
MPAKKMSVTGRLVEAFATTWSAIQKRHPDVPPVVVTMASSTVGAKPGQSRRLGHFAAGRWQQDETTLSELFVSAEGLQRGAVGVLSVLLHEGVHGIAHVRGIQDTSRQGRYHNMRFKVLGEELGLELAKDSKSGWSTTSVPAAMQKVYARQLAMIEAALVAYRFTEITMTEKRSSNLLVAFCECPRKIRIARTTLDEAPIVCTACRKTFATAPDVIT